MWRDVEEVAAAVVREYLSRKGLRKTIGCMDEELPRTNSSMNNQSELCRVLHLESLYKKNKCEEQPLKSMLELMTKERMKKSGDVKRRSSQTDQSTERNSAKPTAAADEAHTQEMSFRLSKTSSRSQLQLRSSTSSPPAMDPNRNRNPTGGTGDGHANRGSRMRRGIMAGPITASTQEDPRRRPARKSAASPSVPNENEEAVSTGTNPRRRSSSADASHTGSDERQNTAPLHIAGLVLDDVDDDDVSFEPSALPNNTFPRHPGWNKRPVDQKTAAALREMFLGSSAGRFSAEWRGQSFSFSNRPALRYGIVQNKGGPCGVLAAVQAAVLHKLLFDGGSSSGDAIYERPSDGVRTKCLSDAVAGILWRAADRKHATVAVNSGRRNITAPTGCVRSDGVLETMDCVEVQSFDDLKLLLEQHIHQFESGPFGCVLLIVSAVLSRTIPKVKGDMDVPTSALIGAHGYCTQELVNLLLCGRAVSNVFDGEMKLDSGNGNFTLLKGIGERSDIGLLSLFEHYNICKVGSYLKNPTFPIWVVCSESHFSVLFSPCDDLTSSRRSPRQFDLYYYDGLANQQEPIRLTVYPDAAVKTPNARDSNSDLTPPLELCIRTRWTDAAVSWNESEPIL